MYAVLEVKPVRVILGVETFTMVPEPRLKPLGPYSTVHDVAASVSVHVNVALSTPTLVKARLLTRWQSMGKPRRNSST